MNQTKWPSIKRPPKLTIKTAGVVLFALVIHAEQVFAQPAASNDAWTKVVASARKEGRVFFYTAATQPVVERLVSGFKAAYPDIAIEFGRYGAGIINSRLEQERTSGADGADLALTSDVAGMLKYAKEGRLLQPIGPAIRTWPTQYIREGRLVTVGLELFVISYNKGLTTRPTNGYPDLLKPELRGKIGTSELDVSPVALGWYDWLEKRQGPEFLAKLKGQNPKLTVSCAPAAASVASGEIAAAALSCISTSRALMRTGAPIDYVVPNPAFGYDFITGALGWSKRPNAALVLMDYLMSRDAQIIWHGSGESASPLPDIPGSLRPTGVQLWDASEYTEAVTKKYREHWNQVFKN